MTRAALAALALALAAAGAAADDGDNPENCRDVWRDIGLPVSKKDERPGDYTFVCHTGYALRHNNRHRTPDYVIERLTAEMVEALNTRPDVDFKEEETAPVEGRATDDDYRNSKYARGHQAASSDFAFDRDWMIGTFFFSNAVPQVGGSFNSSIWSQLEQKVQDIATAREEIYVITGPIYQDFFADEEGNVSSLTVTDEENACGGEVHLPFPKKARVCDANDKNAGADCGDAGVAVPIALYKIIFDPKLHRLNAFILPNKKHPSQAKRGSSTEEYLAEFQVSILNVEERTGYDFFPDFDRRDRRMFEEQCSAMIRR